MLADTVLFSELKEPADEIAEGEETKRLLQGCARPMPAEAVRRILAFCDRPSKWHPEQCTLAEFCAYVARDVLGHIELAAEARIKKPRRSHPGCAPPAELLSLRHPAPTHRCRARGPVQGAPFTRIRANWPACREGFWLKTTHGDRCHCGPPGLD